VSGERTKHFKGKSKIKITLRNIYIVLESSESAEEIKYAEPIFYSTRAQDAMFYIELQPRPV
jgi:hypothetical protein